MLIGPVMHIGFMCLSAVMLGVAWRVPRHVPGATPLLFKIPIIIWPAVEDIRRSFPSPVTSTGNRTHNPHPRYQDDRYSSQ